ncbi:hypothetical protein V6V47_17020 [Micromonospora sp. CPCC 205539]|uniref:hypothetical protein n=1 Tax=Micromonospora sp. CPCC 205539 TaxID=3122408 RepID=UPI002FEE7128
MKAQPPLEPSEWAELAALAPHPGDRELPPGTHELHRDRMLAAIAQETRTPEPARAARRLRPALVGAALVLVVAGVGGGLAATSDDHPPTALPTPEASRPTAAPPPRTAAKIRAYGTVRQLTDSADLIVRGDVVSVTGAGADRRAVYRVAEVLYRASAAPAGAEITLLDPESAGMSRLEAGQSTVLYLAVSDPTGPAYAALSGDFGIFDVTGDTATSRSLTNSVTGLRTEAAAKRTGPFAATLADLRQLARERG